MVLSFYSDRSLYFLIACDLGHCYRVAAPAIDYLCTTWRQIRGHRRKTKPLRFRTHRAVDVTEESVLCAAAISPIQRTAAAAAVKQEAVSARKYPHTRFHVLGRCSTTPREGETAALGTCRHLHVC